MPDIDRRDVQGLVATGYGSLNCATYLLLAIDDAASARGWLGAHLDDVASAYGRAEPTATNLAFTATGLQKLGLPPDAAAGFSLEFQEGIVTPHRSRILGDVDESDPAGWQWGGPTTEAVDALLMLFATDAAELAQHEDAYTNGLAGSGLHLVRRLETLALRPEEHFGFRDGISQPTIDGLMRPARPDDLIDTGEFLLGYPNEYGLYTDRPLLPRGVALGALLPAAADVSSQRDFGANGTYLVFRQLEQDVRAFWSFLDAHAADGSERVRLGAKMVGRWPGGAPLAVSDHDDPALATFNDFAYHHGDPEGLACPVGAHVRRTNPRDSLDPKPGTPDSIAINKRHRILRRGRSYGPWLGIDGALSPPADDEPERGLHFICLNANIARQFEFIQHTWLNDPHFAGLYDDADPVVGHHGRPGSSFTMPAEPVRQRLTGLPQFVRTRGGAYFFLPGLSALRYLAALQA